jgi:hypothetical protein
MASRRGETGVEEAKSGGGVGGKALGESGEINRTVAQEHAEECGADQGEIAGAAYVAAEFLVFPPSNVAAVVIGAFDFPVVAAAGEPLAAGQGAVLE